MNFKQAATTIGIGVITILVAFYLSDMIKNMKENKNSQVEAPTEDA